MFVPGLFLERYRGATGSHRSHSGPEQSLAGDSHVFQVCPVASQLLRGGALEGRAFACLKAISDLEEVTLLGTLHLRVQ